MHQEKGNYQLSNKDIADTMKELSISLHNLLETGI